MCAPPIPARSLRSPRPARAPVLASAPVRRAVAPLLVALSLAMPGLVRAQGTLLLRVVDGEGVALVNAEVLDQASGAHRFTDERGEARLPWPPEGLLRLRVRQLGFRFAERSLERREVGDGPVVVTLERVAYALPEVFTGGERPCETGGDAASRLLSASVIEQLRMAAERYASFERSFPFRVEQERLTLRYEAGELRAGSRTRERTDSDVWGEPYQPERVLLHRGRGFSVPVLFITALGDARFWEHHCFIVRGVSTYAGGRVFRLEFFPTPKVTSPDWAGIASVDSATSLLRRVEFQLVNLADGDTPRRFEGYTTFAQPSPFIVVPDSTAVLWWRRPPDPALGWGNPDALQVLRVTRISYRRRTPPPSPTAPATVPSSSSPSRPPAREP